MYKNNSDPILSIIKSIKPQKFIYSKQNKQFNKYFLSLNPCGNNFNKILDKIHKTNTNINFHKKESKLKKINKSIVDEEIQKIFNRLERMNYNKYLPRTLINKMKIYNLEERQKQKKNEENNKIKKLKKITQLDEKYYNGITLDPGRYDPKYNLIFRRTKDIYIGRPKTTYKIYNFENENNLERINIKKTKHKLLMMKDNEIIKGKNKQCFILSNNKNISLRTKHNNYSRNNIMNKNFSNYNKNIQSRTMTPNIKTNNRKFVKEKEYKTKKIFSSKNKELNDNYNFDFGNNNNNEEEINKETNRCSSSIGFNKGISFDKTPGRKSNIFNIKEETKNMYYPKYDIIRPHMYVKQFIVRNSLNNYKKYAVGKIIRNYRFSPKDYFIFDINSKNENELDNNFLSFIKRKYKLYNN